ncbi:hypothetical protein CYMTET_32796 [Cymbomonas tetramitiformis]|uniref:Uncharacterized protein n=1 Tax=Cymbomonas tetramitiformis TaxID=36881 RepID=A0AAE0FE42_9CHLO|nr:hypothetical protein CYMTET_32796 [Cymbomonas tetramitiformis]
MTPLCLLPFTHARPVRNRGSFFGQKKVVAPKLQNIRRTSVRRSESVRTATSDSDEAAEVSAVEEAVVASEAHTELSPAEILAELQAANQELRSSLSNSLQELQAKHGETDEEAVSLLALSPQSLADLAEDIEWATPEDEIPFWFVPVSLTQYLADLRLAHK